MTMEAVAGFAVVESVGDLIDRVVTVARLANKKSDDEKPVTEKTRKALVAEFAAATAEVELFLASVEANLDFDWEEDVLQDVLDSTRMMANLGRRLSEIAQFLAKARVLSAAQRDSVLRTHARVVRLVEDIDDGISVNRVKDAPREQWKRESRA